MSVHHRQIVVVIFLADKAAGILAECPHFIGERLGVADEFRFIQHLIDLAKLWNWFRFVILIVVIAGMLHALYRSASVHNPKAKNTLPGAVIASLLITTVSAVFSAVISFSVKYSLVYGSLASMIILLFWLYILGNIIIIGALINQEINEQSTDTKINYHKNITKFIKNDD